jgi:hypothetical protein
VVRFLGLIALRCAGIVYATENLSESLRVQRHQIVLMLLGDRHTGVCSRAPLRPSPSDRGGCLFSGICLCRVDTMLASRIRASLLALTLFAAGCTREWSLSRLGACVAGPVGSPQALQSANCGAVFSDGKGHTRRLRCIAPESADTTTMLCRCEEDADVVGPIVTVAFPFATQMAQGADTAKRACGW